MSKIVFILLICSSEVFSFSWAGEWTSTFGDIQLIEKQTGYKDHALVYGNYDKNGFLVGTSVGNKLHGIFYDPDSNKNGRFVFSLTGTENAYEGIWSFDNIDKESKWNGTRSSSQRDMPLIGLDRYRSAEGIWDTNFGKLELIQESVFIEGTYDKKGKLYAVFSQANNLLFGFFTNKDKYGLLKFQLNNQKTTFEGVWSWQTGKWAEQKWTGRKTSKLQ